MKQLFRSMVCGGLACGLMLFGTSWAYSQTRIRETQRTTTTEVRGVSAVIGASVRLTGDATFGKVEDIIINDQGCIDFVVVVFEEKLFAVPFTLARLDFANRVVFFEIERERFLRAPSFARGRFPDFSVNSEFSREVHSFFRTQGERRGGTHEAQPRDSKTPDRNPPATRPPDRKPPDTRPPDRQQPEDRRPPADKKPVKDKDQKPPKDKEDKSGGQ